MTPRNYLILSCAALSIHGMACSAELHVDFRHKVFDNVALKLTGNDAEQLVVPTERGLLIRIPAKEGVIVPVGVAPRSTIHGDFEITGEYELLRYEQPRDGYGVGVGIVVEFPAAMDMITIERFAVPSQGDTFTSTRIQSADGNRTVSSRRIPARSRAGKLRLVRTGASVRTYYADGGDSFKLLRELDVGSDDARILQFGADTGSKAYRVEVLLKSLGIRADELIESPESSVPSKPWIHQALLILIPILGVILGVAVWRLRPTGWDSLLKQRVY
jgi:hypothetical protein